MKLNNILYYFILIQMLMSSDLLNCLLDDENWEYKKKVQSISVFEKEPLNDPSFLKCFIENSYKVLTYSDVFSLN